MFFATVGMATALAAPGERHALLIGIDAYKDRRHFAALKGASNDAEAIAKVLIARGGFEAKNVRCLTTRQAAAPPSGDNIRKAMIDLISRSKPDDLVLIYVAGHGVTMGDSAFLVPYDAEVSMDQSTGKAVASPFLMNLVQASQLTELGSMKARQIVAVFDICRNDPFTFDSGPNRSINLTAAMQASLSSFRSSSTNAAARGSGGPLESSVMFACQQFGTSQEDAGKQRGVFSLQFERALSEGDTNGDGQVSIGEIESYVTTKVKSLSGGKQIPFCLSDSLIRDTGLSYTDKQKAKLKPVPDEVPEFTAQPSRQIEFRESETKIQVFDGAYQISVGDQWCEIVSGEGGFTIRMPEPEEPKRRESPVTTPDGEAKLIEYAYKKRKNYDLISFSAGFFDYPEAGMEKSEKELLEWAKKALVDGKTFGKEYQADTDEAVKQVSGSSLQDFAKVLFPRGSEIDRLLRNNPLSDILGGGNRGSTRTPPRNDRNEPRARPIRTTSRDYDIADAPGWRTEMTDPNTSSYVYLQIAVAGHRVFVLREAYNLEEGKHPRYPKQFLSSFDFID